MKYDRDTIIDVLEHCTRLDGDNFPHPNCIECPVRDDCKKCVGHIPYEMKEPLLALLKEQHKKGHWFISNQTNIYGATKVTCSNCNDSVMVQNIKDELFCRHCGADMRTVVDH